MNPNTTKNMRSPASTKPVIYAVDDEVMILEMIAVILEPLGYRVITFSDPLPALDALAVQSPRPVLIITDYAMHGMNGMGFIEKCRALLPDQKIVLASGTVSQDIYATSPTKPDCFLAKPFKPHELVEAVQGVIRG
jgi:CheY-like chemotaxis protein